MGRDPVFGPNHSMEREIHASIEKARAEVAGEVGPVGEWGPRGPGPCPMGPPGPEGSVGCIDNMGPTGYEVELANDERESVRWLLGQLREHRERLNNLQVENAFLSAKVDQQSKDIVKVQGEILAAVMIGVAEGRVHWNMQVHVAQPVEALVAAEGRGMRAEAALREAQVRGDTPEEAVRAILAAIDAPPEANTSSPSTEGLLDKEVEDHG